MYNYCRRINWKWKFIFKKLAKSLRKILNCSASIINKDNEKIIQLSGDKRQDIANYLINYKITDKKQIRIHWF